MQERNTNYNVTEKVISKITEYALSQGKEIIKEYLGDKKINISININIE